MHQKSEIISVTENAPWGIIYYPETKSAILTIPLNDVRLGTHEIKLSTIDVGRLQSLLDPNNVVANTTLGGATFKRLFSYLDIKFAMKSTHGEDLEVSLTLDSEDIAQLKSALNGEVNE